MVVDIDISNLTSQIVTRDAQNNITSISGTGIFDVMLDSVSTFMEYQQQEAKITQSQYAELMAQFVPALLSGSIDFVMKSALTTAQVNKTIAEQELTYAERIIKDKEAALMGLDDVAVNARKAQDGNSVYVPAYIQA